MPNLSKEVFDSRTIVTKLESQFPSGVIGLPIQDPLLTWQVRSEHDDAIQLAYEISSINEKGEIHTGEVVPSSSQVENAALGHGIQAREIRKFRVRIATQYGWSQYSPDLIYETGLTVGANLVGNAIGDDSRHSEPSPILRKTFTTRSKIKKARLYVASHGLNNMYINGSPAAQEFMTPGWTSYDDRSLIHTYDVTQLLLDGNNCISAELGDGWTRGKLGFLRLYDNYNKSLALLAQLEITYEDGSQQQVITDSSWRVSQGAIRFGDIYDGCEIDYTKEETDWKLSGFNDSHWSTPTIHDFNREILEPRIAPPTVEVSRFPGVVLHNDGRTLIDFHQNISGWVRLTVDGKKGDVVVIKHAEVLEDRKRLHLSALRTAKAMDTYTLGYDGVNVLVPQFTFHGFQFAEVTGPAKFISAVGIAISAASVRRGHFDSSSDKLNRLHENVVWSIADNMVTLPTDCPQRDERLGWTGDAQAIASASNTIFNLDSFWRSWLRDLWKDQERNGHVGAVVPDLLSKQPAPGDDTGMIMQNRAGWADAATIVPFSVYENYASLYSLREQLPSIRHYVESLDTHRKGAKFLPTEFQFGDWCDPDAPGEEPWKAKVSADFVANAYFAHTAELAASVENLVGDASYAEKFIKLANELKRDTWQEFGAAAAGTTAGASIALEFEIAPAHERDAIANSLSATVLNEDGRISTGFLGTPLILHALSKSGKLEAAFTMLMRRKVFSWLYQVDCGATTVWERWDAIREDGSLHTGEIASYEEENKDESMISYNHYAYGAVMDWVYQNVAGLAPIKGAPGYQEFKIAPKIPAGMSYAQASIETPYGLSSIRWDITSHSSLSVVVHVPFGTHAVLDLPTTEKSEIFRNGVKEVQGAKLGYGTHTIWLSHPEIVAFKQVY